MIFRKKKRPLLEFKMKEEQGVIIPPYQPDFQTIMYNLRKDHFVAADRFRARYRHLSVVTQASLLVGIIFLIINILTGDVRFQLAALCCLAVTGVIAIIDHFAASHWFKLQREGYEEGMKWLRLLAEYKKTSND